MIRTDIVCYAMKALGKSVVHGIFIFVICQAGCEMSSFLYIIFTLERKKDNERKEKSAVGRGNSS